jgi:hypothetical protein
MASLKFPRFWWSCGWLMIASVCVGSLLPLQQHTLILRDDKIVHALAYGTLMLWFSGLVTRRRRLATVAGLLFLLGFALDMLQSTVATRSFDPWDIAANGAGILAAWMLAQLLLAGWCERVERFFAV